MNYCSLYLYRSIVHYNMSPRIKTLRRVLNPPVIKGFKPYGPDSGNQKTESVVLHYEEYEALRLCDYENHNHHHASVMMQVSRPTLTRIYASALQKIAKAFVEGRKISIEGGKVYFDSSWHHCKSCDCYFNNPDKDIKIQECPLCGDGRIVNVELEKSQNIQADHSGNERCICIDCGWEILHERGQPCSRQICPNCQGVMRKKRKSDSPISHTRIK
jgi:uncharacterized protein